MAWMPAAHQSLLTGGLHTDPLLLSTSGKGASPAMGEQKLDRQRGCGKLRGLQSPAGDLLTSCRSQEGQDAAPEKEVKARWSER